MYDLEGKYIVVNVLNCYFHNDAKMFLEHFDTEEYDNVVFVMGSYIRYEFDYFKNTYKDKRIIIWQTEQLLNDQTSLNFHNAENIINTLHKVPRDEGHEIWEMCHMNQVFAEDYGLKVDRLVPVRFTESLRELNTCNQDEDIDVLFYGNLNKKRANVLYNLSFELFHENVSLMWLGGMDFSTQKKYIEKSKIILNLHHTDVYNRQEQPRIYYPLINKKCVLSETSQHNYFGKAIIESDLNSLGQTILSLLKDDRYRQQAEIGFNTFKEEGAFWRK